MNTTLEMTVVDRILQAVNLQSPLIHNVTNMVVMQTTANVLLAMGASPLMAHAQQEIVEIVSISHALVLNIGTLDEMWIQAMRCAQSVANEQHKPIVLDPVGAGASEYRTQIAKQILQAGVTLVRGNAAEIMALTDQAIVSHGVDSVYTSLSAVEAARQIACQYNCCVVISGEVDYVCDAERCIEVSGGDVLLTKVTGMGCSTTAMIAACIAVESDAVHAAVAAMTCMAESAQNARLQSSGPGSFFPVLLDEIAKRCGG